MAHTYTNLPPSLSHYLSEVVDSVNTNISSEIGKTIEFRHNGFTALMNELVEARPTDAKYPLIALIQPYTFEYDGNSDSPKVRFDLLILTDSLPTQSSDERETDNYDAILRPIYAELIKQIVRYPNFSFEGRLPKHNGMDIYHIGSDRGTKNGYVIPDVLDCITIEGMELQIHAENDCLIHSTGCIDTHDIDLYHNINSYTVTGNGTANLVVGLLEAKFFESDLDTGPPVFTLNDGNEGIYTIEELTPESINIGAFPNGVYIGRITSDHGAYTEFEYNVRNGLVYGICKVFANTTFQPLVCEDSFSYPLNIVSESQCAGVTTIAYYDVNIESGIVVDDKTYSPMVATISESYTTAITQLLNSYYTNVRTSNGNTLTNKIIINLKNI